jgi:hydroxymethylbilane synthase
MKLRVGTRDSKLALWQAEAVANELRRVGIESEIVPLKSQGDLDLKTPLHLMGGTGLFTKVLDEVLLNNSVDIAVHSLKDYPTVAPEGIRIAAVMEREEYQDILVYKDSLDFLENTQAIIATGSIRRKAQWLHRYPKHELTNLRGNVITRLEKLHNNNWHGAVFAKAGLKRLNLIPENHLQLDWMIPAPAQGVVGITCRTNDHQTFDILQKINHTESWETSIIERKFLNTLEGGCSAPIGALAKKTSSGFEFTGGVFRLDGSQAARIETTFNYGNPEDLGREAAEKVLEMGGREIMKEIREKA